MSQQDWLAWGLFRTYKTASLTRVHRLTAQRRGNRKLSLEIINGWHFWAMCNKSAFHLRQTNPIFPKLKSWGALWLHTSAAPFHEWEASSRSVRGPRSELWERALAQRSWAWARASARQDWATGWTFCKACDRNWKWTCITVRKHRPSTWKRQRLLW